MAMSSSWNHIASFVWISTPKWIILSIMAYAVILFTVLIKSDALTLQKHKKQIINRQKG